MDSILIQDVESCSEENVEKDDIYAHNCIASKFRTPEIERAFMKYNFRVWLPYFRTLQAMSCAHQLLMLASMVVDPMWYPFASPDFNIAVASGIYSLAPWTMLVSIFTFALSVLLYSCSHKLRASNFQIMVTTWSLIMITAAFVPTLAASLRLEDATPKLPLRTLTGESTMLPRSFGFIVSYVISLNFYLIVINSLPMLFPVAISLLTIALCWLRFSALYSLATRESLSFSPSLHLVILVAAIFFRTLHIRASFRFDAQSTQLLNQRIQRIEQLVMEKERREYECRLSKQKYARLKRLYRLRASQGISGEAETIHCLAGHQGTWAPIPVHTIAKTQGALAQLGDFGEAGSQHVISSILRSPTCPSAAATVRPAQVRPVPVRTPQDTKSASLQNALKSLGDVATTRQHAAAGRAQLATLDLEGGQTGRLEGSAAAQPYGEHVDEREEVHCKQWSEEDVRLCYQHVGRCSAIDRRSSGRVSQFSDNTSASWEERFLQSLRAPDAASRYSTESELEQLEQLEDLFPEAPAELLQPQHTTLLDAFTGVTDQFGSLLARFKKLEKRLNVRKYSPLGSQKMQHKQLQQQQLHQPLALDPKLEKRHPNARKYSPLGSQKIEHEQHQLHQPQLLHRFQKLKKRLEIQKHSPAQWFSGNTG